ILSQVFSAEECQQLAALYPQNEPFRSHILMARHGFGRGEYKYFAYPLPTVIADLRSALYEHLVPIANSWEASLSSTIRYSDEHADLPLALPCSSADQTDATALAVRVRRLHLPTSGPLRRGCVPNSGDHSALRPWSRLHGRRICAHRAAPAHANAC